MKKRGTGSGSTSPSPSSSTNSSDNSNESKELVKYGFHGPSELLTNRKKKDYFIKLAYQNTLPDAPCDAKHILMSMDPLKFALPPKDVRPFYEQLLDKCCGVPIDLIGSALHWKTSSDRSVELDSRDKMLLEDDFIKGMGSMVKRSKTHNTSVTWLRRTEYISTEPAKFKTQHGDKMEYRVDKAIGKKFKTESKWDEYDYLQDRKARIKSIEKSFEDATPTIIEHHEKPGVVAEDVIPVFPDFDLWKYSFLEVVFDTPPSASTNLGKIDETQMKDALLQGMCFKGQDENIERIGYFVPPNTLKVSFAEDEIGHSNEDINEYSLARDFVFKQGTNNSFPISETCLFLEKEGVLTYCEINKRINLNRSIKTDSQSSLRGPKVKANVTYRSPSEQEKEIWRQREKTLELIDPDTNDE